MQVGQLTVNLRSSAGKGPARQLRHQSGRRVRLNPPRHPYGVCECHPEADDGYPGGPAPSPP